MPVLPTTSAEGVTALVHYYRGELSRMISWRDRLDVTTNWAIGAVAAMLSIALSAPDSHHAVLLFAMLIVYILLLIEARRYRFFHVYRCRVRQLERYYFAQLFAPTPVNPTQWLAEIGEDLRVPKFTISLRQAMARRLRRNYGWIFLLLLLAWSLKITSALLQPRGDAGVIHSSREFFSTAAMPGISGGLVIACVIALYGWLAFIAFRYEISELDVGAGHVHV
ncbi:MAG: DUF2270 domain-containing protein [Steroidobacteraceae bacterium]